MLTILALPVLALALPADPAENSQNYCIAFEDNFNGPLDNSQWRHDVTMGGGGNWEFEMYVNNRSNSYTENGVLYIMPTLTADIIGVDKVVNGGAIDLWADGCNSNGTFLLTQASLDVSVRQMASTSSTPFVRHPSEQLIHTQSSLERLKSVQGFLSAIGSGRYLVCNSGNLDAPQRPAVRDLASIRRNRYNGEPWKRCRRRSRH